jgi:2-amino-4-hydroxy-6-hydroxymethyldihydropteridine diphosphokinase
MSEPSWVPAYIAIGSNLNEPERQVLAAFERIAMLPQTRLEARSRLYRTRPMGPQNQPDFVNAAAGVLTQLTPRGLLDLMLAIERAMGRDRRGGRERWGPRIIDLDLIWFAGEPIDEPGLQLPHPGVSDRNFVLYPLADIAPDVRIPGHGWVSDLKARAGGEGLSLMQTGDSVC